jgi:hypothetical protein
MRRRKVTVDDHGWLAERVEEDPMAERWMNE